MRTNRCQDLLEHLGTNYSGLKMLYPFRSSGNKETGKLGPYRENIQTSVININRYSVFIQKCLRVSFPMKVKR